MYERDLHKSLKSEVLTKTTSSGVTLALVKLAWGKNDVAFSLHVAPNSFSTAGLQIPDLLNYIGFSRQPCLYLGGECYAKQVGENFDVNLFGTALANAYKELDQAERYLERCGFRLAQPEGWGYFFGKPSGRSERHHYSGDGHISAVPPQRIKTSEDDIFHFAFTWIKNSEREKGWTIHYKPKHFPLSVEIRSVFKFLRISQFAQCPEFDFEPCNWRHIEFVQRGDGPFDSNVEIANSWFDAHQQNFTPAIKSLLAAQATMEQVGMGFLPSFEKPEIRRVQEITQRVSKSKPETKKSGPKLNPNFDVAISFAGTERKYAEQLANRVKAAGFDVFYDGFYPEELWGKNLVEFFHEIYSKRSRYCVIFVSNEYLNREWTIHERRSAQERMLKEKGNEYILPVKVDDVELPGIPTTIGYLPIEAGIESISNALLNKLRKS